MARLIVNKHFDKHNDASNGFSTEQEYSLGEIIICNDKENPSIYIKNSDYDSVGISNVKVTNDDKILSKNDGGELYTSIEMVWDDVNNQIKLYGIDKNYPISTIDLFGDNSVGGKIIEKTDRVLNIETIRTDFENCPDNLLPDKNYFKITIFSNGKESIQYIPYLIEENDVTINGDDVIIVNNTVSGVTISHNTIDHVVNTNNTSNFGQSTYIQSIEVTDEGHIASITQATLPTPSTTLQKDMSFKAQEGYYVYDVNPNENVGLGYTVTYRELPQTDIDVVNNTGDNKESSFDFISEISSDGNTILYKQATVDFGKYYTKQESEDKFVDTTELEQKLKNLGLTEDGKLPEIEITVDNSEVGEGKYVSDVQVNSIDKTKIKLITNDLGLNKYVAKNDVSTENSEVLAWGESKEIVTIADKAITATLPSKPGVVVTTEDDEDSNVILVGVEESSEETDEIKFKKKNFNFNDVLTNKNVIVYNDSLEWGKAVDIAKVGDKIVQATLPSNILNIENSEDTIGTSVVTNISVDEADPTKLKVNYENIIPKDYLVEDDLKGYLKNNNIEVTETNSNIENKYIKTISKTITESDNVAFNVEYDSFNDTLDEIVTIPSEVPVLEWDKETAIGKIGNKEIKVQMPSKPEEADGNTLYKLETVQDGERIKVTLTETQNVDEQGGTVEINLTEYVTNNDIQGMNLVKSDTLNSYALKSEIPSITITGNTDDSGFVSNIDVNGHTITVTKTEVSFKETPLTIVSEGEGEFIKSIKTGGTNGHDIVLQKGDAQLQLDVTNKHATLRPGESTTIAEINGNVISVMLDPNLTTNTGETPTIKTYRLEQVNESDTKTTITLYDELNADCGNAIIDTSKYITDDILSNKGYITNTELEGKGYITDTALEGYVTNDELSKKGYITDTVLTNKGYITSTELEGKNYITDTELESKGYVTDDDLSKKGYITDTVLDTKGYITDTVLSSKGYITDTILEGKDYVTNDELTKKGYITDTELEGKNYVTDTTLESKGYITDTALEGYVTNDDLSKKGYITDTALEGKNYVTDTVLSGKGYITNTELEGKGYVTDDDLSKKNFITTGDTITIEQHYSPTDSKIEVFEATDGNYISKIKYDAKNHIVGIDSKEIPETKYTAGDFISVNNKVVSVLTGNTGNSVAVGNHTHENLYQPIGEYLVENDLGVLTFESGVFTGATFKSTNSTTVKIPTLISHLTNDTEFITKNDVGVTKISYKAGDCLEGSGEIVDEGIITFSHSKLKESVDNKNAISLDNNDEFIAITAVNKDEFGHVTDVTTSTYTLPLIDLSKKADSIHKHSKTDITDFAHNHSINEITGIDDKIASYLAANDAMIFKGVINESSNLPIISEIGWAFKSNVKSVIFGESIEIGDLIICIADNEGAELTAENFSDFWTIVQTNTDGVVVGPSSSVTGNIPIFDGTTGKLIKDSGLSIKTSVPENALFTDTNYYLTDINGSANGEVTLTRNGLDSLMWNTKHTHNEYVLNTVFEENEFVVSEALNDINETLNDLNDELAKYAKKTELPGVFTGATSSEAGIMGLVPAPTTDDTAKFLKADGSWGTPLNTVNTAGSFHDTGKLYFIGAKNQTDNELDGIVTYSNSAVYMREGDIYANAIFVNSIDDYHYDDGNKISEYIDEQAKYTISENSFNKLYLLGAEEQNTKSLTKSHIQVYMEKGSLYALGYYQTSDERCKDFGEDIEIDFDKLKEIPKKYFTWKSDDTKKVDLGTSAQKVRELYPELVGGDDDTTLSVDYAKLSIVALKAVDKLHEENEMFKAELDMIKKHLGL